ncbi:pyridoxal-dependent decarboxylase [Annulohypoxylon maeteangense]|uniref:pyridoxal-dependent decarboxylase n=1 Tax=Annulohypoxylon maeteangense TaxID=1927788 RepID=UPI002007EABE|nr:pyridoxal-dependent decarboxylase [Annulohypoxylon maeteangense]KAI0888249.1 pyridoxal-dependent decarboxylase [Annulohypoxylon maeteangense]
MAAADVASISQAPVPGYIHATPSRGLYRDVDQAIHDYIGASSKLEHDFSEDEPFFVADLGQVLIQHQKWQKYLPMVEPFYAVKCNPDLPLLRYLGTLGTGFDCASIEEIRTMLSWGVEPSRIIFANPCKSPSSVRFARSVGVYRTTCDNIDELEKIHFIMPEAMIVLRLFASDPEAMTDLSDKFGATKDVALDLLKRARQLGMNVEGVSFHVGSGSRSATAFETALRDSKHILEVARSLGFKSNLLDIGGGFLDEHFVIVAEKIRCFIETEIPSDIRVIAEPGRFYVQNAYSLVTKVIARRQATSQHGVSTIGMLYQNDGIYRNFMNAVFENLRPEPQLIRSNINPIGPEAPRRTRCEHEYHIWGPTCDSRDSITKTAIFDSEVLVGDWLKYKDMGAYTLAMATRFNGFDSQCKIVYVSSKL